MALKVELGMETDDRSESDIPRVNGRIQKVLQVVVGCG